jgi:O-antigen/teichoic acid export membrane protein
MNTENNKRIAKNTALLYFRMLLTMMVSLYTVRVVLETLGILDYGIYNVVGGVVSMFAFLSNSMASASQRFLAFEIGKNDEVKLKNIFSVTVSIYVIISIIVLILAETIGLWFVNSQMSIPENRIEAANWVYQFSILSFILTINTIPYNAAIIARENMKAFAYISIFEVILKLGVVFILLLFSADKLKLYSSLVFISTLIVAFIYKTYCKKNYVECTYRFFWNKIMFREILTYSGWNIIGSISVVSREQGVNLLLNVFFNPIVNASRGIASQINMMLLSFTTNFYSAVRPQITKSYAAGDYSYTHDLVCQSSKMAFYLIMVLSLPILLETNWLLTVWLNEIPSYAILFTQLIIINSLIEVFNLPLVAAIQATGRIKLYQTTVSILLLLNLPISYVFLKLGYSPEITMLVSIVLSLLSFIPRIWICKIEMGLSVKFYLNKVLLPSVLVFLFTMSLSIMVHFCFNEGLLRLVLVSSAVLFSSIFAVYSFGITTNERKIIFSFIIKKTK